MTLPFWTKCKVTEQKHWNVWNLMGKKFISLTENLKSSNLLPNLPVAHKPTQWFPVNWKRKMLLNISPMRISEISLRNRMFCVVPFLGLKTSWCRMIRSAVWTGLYRLEGLIEVRAAQLCWCVLQLSLLPPAVCDVPSLLWETSCEEIRSSVKNRLSVQLWNKHLLTKWCSIF